MAQTVAGSVDSATGWREGGWFVSQSLDMDAASQARTEEEARPTFKPKLIGDRGILAEIERTTDPAPDMLP